MNAMGRIEGAWKAFALTLLLLAVAAPNGGCGGRGHRADVVEGASSLSPVSTSSSLAPGSPVSIGPSVGIGPRDAPGVAAGLQDRPLLRSRVQAGNDDGVDPIGGVKQGQALA